MKRVYLLLISTPLAYMHKSISNRCVSFFFVVYISRYGLVEQTIRTVILQCASVFRRIHCTFSTYAIDWPTKNTIKNQMKHITIGFFYNLSIFVSCAQHTHAQKYKHNVCPYRFTLRFFFISHHSIFIFFGRRVSAFLFGSSICWTNIYWTGRIFRLTFFACWI